MRRWIVRIGSGLLVLLALAAVVAWWTLRGSLPRLDGDGDLAGLSAPVTVQRDALGVVTIEAESEIDAMRALGYVHAQERFFEMDLLRRTAAGELAGLFGPKAVEVDKQRRVHRMRARVQAQFDAIAGDRKAVLQAYADGVNAGLAALRVRPWPYVLLRQQPRAWRTEDTPLVAYAMYFDLQDASNARELALWKLQPHVPPALYALLTHGGSSWDAPLVGAPFGDARLPEAAQVDLRKLPALARADVPALPVPLEVGSNNFAVSGAATRDGRAILANDMHLTLRVPNIWFRAQLRYPDARAEGGRVDIGGFTLPGLPGVVVGSNGHVAWGFTNSYIDSADWAVVRRCPTCAPLRRIRETIEVAGAAPVAFDVQQAPWGPVLAHDASGNALALRWAAHLPGSLRMAFMDMAYARTVDDALARANRMAIPAQNLLLADSKDIAWRILGPIPERSTGCHVAMPVAADCRMTLRTDASPAVAKPISGRLWTANSRVVDDGAYARLGDGGYALGARAKQIRDDLFARPNFDERALLAVQLDDRAVFLARWWHLLQDESRRARSPALRALADAAKTWEGRASTDSVGYRIVRNWRRAVHERLADGLTAPAQAAMGKDFAMPSLPQFEGVAWPLVAQRPAHLLPRKYKTWDALFEDAARDVRDNLESEGPLAERTWGEQNTARICHPLVRALPFAKSLLCMPFEALPGDGAMPRVQSPDMGASERMVVSPGHEADGIIHMPGGQSGHVLSPFWGAGHEDWVQGRPTPFLPGEPEHRMTLRPSR
jgi:penicillin amidase